MRTMLLALCALTIATGADAPRVYEPGETVALAKQWPRGKAGRFAMTVAATGVTPSGTFLNSSADYRADDNVTFRLSPVLSRTLAKRYGAPPAAYLTGKRVVVAGVVADQRIVEFVGHQPPRFLRMQHQVALDRVGQIVSVE